MIRYNRRGKEALIEFWDFDKIMNIWREGNLEIHSFYRCRVLEEEFRFCKISITQCGSMCTRGERRNSGFIGNTLKEFWSGRT